MAAGQPKSQGGESPLDKERDRGPSQPEQTPEKPKDQSGADPQKPKPGAEQPKSDHKNPLTGENRNSQPRQDPAGAPVTPADDTERWGMLPERVQQVFQNQITDDLPLQYRDWIDSYYRRLSKSR
jgi:hypothetical protein